MVFSVVDAHGLILAILAATACVALPGFALARLLGFSRVREEVDPLAGVVVGLAILPGLDSLLTRCLGLDAAFGLTLGLAAFGVGFVASRGIPALRPSGIALALLGVWLVLLLVEWIDFDIQGQLFQPLTVVDTVKHAATTQAILDSGAPPRDAFFLRPERASYYYFFYTLAALVQRSCFGLIDAKAAVGGLIFWVGIGVYGLVRLALGRIGAETAAFAGRLPLAIVAVLAIGGLDLLAVLFIAVKEGYWLADPMQWNAQISIWSGSVLWVPHHVTALIAGTVGLMALSDLVDDPAAGTSRVLRNVALAALGFASSLGLSVWVTLALVMTAAIWGALLLIERQWRAVVLLGCAGVLAIAIAALQILDLRSGRGGPLPIIVEVREFAPVDELVPPGVWRTLARVVLLPLNYFIEFGALSLGAFLYWRQQARERAAVTAFGRVLAIAALSGILLGSVFRSLIFNNDLGWRVMLFPLLAASVWTIAAFGRRLSAAAGRGSVWRASFPLLATVVVGWGTSLAVVVSMRAYPMLPLNPASRFVAADPATERALREAYGWAAANLPRSHVLQHNPTRARAFAFALYGRNRTALSDRYGSLYGADFDVVKGRLDRLAPIYKDALTAAAVRAAAEREGIDDLVVTAADPVWSRPDSFVWRSKPAYASDRVRIIALDALRS